MKALHQFRFGSDQSLLRATGAALLLFLCFAGVSRARAAVAETHSPSPVLVGGKLTFTFTLSGLGTPPGVLTNRLPPNTVFVSATVTNGTYTVSNNVFAYRPATTPDGTALVFELVLTPVTAQIITNEACWVPSSGPVFRCGSTVPVTPVLVGPNMVVGRVDHQATRLRDGRVLVTGGLAVVGPYLAPTNAAEVYDPAADTFTLVGSMNAPRQYHTATLLNNGMVLVAGGQRATGSTNATLELFDPTNNVFIPAGNMTGPRASHTATLLPNGDVILAGGDGANRRIERFSLADGQPSVSLAGTLAVARKEHLATLLPSGEILFAGGGDAASAFAEKFNPGTGVSVPLASKGRALPAVAIAQGKVLLYGWTVQPDYAGELYDPETDSFETLTDVPGPANGMNFLTLSTGEVLVSSGYTAFNVYLFNVRTGAFRPFYPVSITRSHHSAVELADGRVLLIGGYDLINIMSGDMRSTELYAIRLDMDQDGMDDAWELANGFDPANRADAIEDADGDGHSNLQEYLAGTDPHDPASALRFESVQRNATSLVIRFSSVVGKFYRVQRTADVAHGTWVDVGGTLAGTGRPVEVTDTIVPGAGKQLYRVLLLP